MIPFSIRLRVTATVKKRKELFSVLSFFSGYRQVLIEGVVGD